jgi:hypothetical protein
MEDSKLLRREDSIVFRVAGYIHYRAVGAGNNWWGDIHLRACPQVWMACARARMLGCSFHEYKLFVALSPCAQNVSTPCAAHPTTGGVIMDSVYEITKTAFDNVFSGFYSMIICLWGE